MIHSFILIYTWLCIEFYAFSNVFKYASYSYKMNNFSITEQMASFNQQWKISKLHVSPNQQLYCAKQVALFEELQLNLNLSFFDKNRYYLYKVPPWNEIQWGPWRPISSIGSQVPGSVKSSILSELLMLKLNFHTVEAFCNDQELAGDSC